MSFLDRRLLTPAVFSTGGDPHYPGSIIDFDFASGRYYWGGSTSLSTAVSCYRPDAQIALGQNADGTWSSFDPNVARVLTGIGLLVEVATTNFLPWSRNFKNPVWALTNATITDSGINPIVGTQPFTVEILPAGTTAWIAPPGVTLLTQVCAIGPGGNGAAGVNNTTSGGGGGGGALASRANVAVVVGTSHVVQVGAAGSGVATFFKDAASVTQVSAQPGLNASGVTGGTGGLSAASVGLVVRSGGNGGAGATAGVTSQGGGGGGSAANTVDFGGTNAVGRNGLAGTSNGGAGGQSVGGGTNPTQATAGAGGVGGNYGGVGGGTGGTTAVLAGAGSNGGGGGGGKSSVGIAGAAGASLTWSYSQGATVQTFNGPGGAGGGGGLAGDGGAGGPGSGGGGGGFTPAAHGAGGAGGDGFLLLIYGSANASRMTATAANATLAQTFTTPASINKPSILIRPQTVTGAIKLSIDGGITQTDVSSQFVAGRFQQVSSPYDTVVGPITFHLEIVNSGDIIDIDLGQVEGNPMASSPIPRGANTASRFSDRVTLNLANFPDFITGDAVTFMTTQKPNREGSSVLGATTALGWSWADMGGFGTTLGTIDVSGIASSVMTVTNTNGILLDDHMGITGAGVAAGTIIFTQLTGTPGGAGTYSIVPAGQTTGAITADAIPQYGYIANARPAPGQQVGVTVINSATNLYYGFDPQTAEFVYHAWNRMAFTTSATAEAGIVALAGDIEFSTPRGSWALPAFFTEFVIGAVRDTAAGNPVCGPVANLIVLPTYDPTGAEIAAWTALPYP